MSGYRPDMVGLMTKGEFATLVVCILTQMAGLLLAVTTSAVAVAGLLVVLAAGCQIAVALSFIRRRKAQGVWRTDRQ